MEWNSGMVEYWNSGMTTITSVDDHYPLYYGEIEKKKELHSKSLARPEC